LTQQILLSNNGALQLLPGNIILTTQERLYVIAMLGFAIGFICCYIAMKRKQKEEAQNVTE